MEFFLKLAKSSPKVSGERERENSLEVCKAAGRETYHDFLCLVPKARKTGEISCFVTQF